MPKLLNIKKSTSLLLLSFSLLISGCGFQLPSLGKEVKVNLSLFDDGKKDVVVGDADFAKIIANPCVALRVCSDRDCKDSSLKKAIVTESTYSVKLTSEAPRLGSAPYCVQLVAFAEDLLVSGGSACSRKAQAVELARQSWSPLSGSNLTLTPQLRDLNPTSYIQPGSGCKGPFISTWATGILTQGSSNEKQITLPMISSGTYNFTVDWGDGRQDTITDWNDERKTHTYDQIGNYQVKISGIFNGFSFSESNVNGRDRAKLRDISQFGILRLGNSGYYFYGASSMSITAKDALDLTGTTSLQGAFQYCSYMSTVPSMSQWDTSQVKSMANMFQGIHNFSQDIGNWDISNVTDMTGMFSEAQLSTENYDSLLSGWGSQAVQSGVTFDAGSSKYSTNGIGGRTKLVNKQWIITDGGQVP
jgi:surface protein